MIKTEFSLKEQFEGFISTPQIFAENSFFEYPLFHTSGFKNEYDQLTSLLTEPESRVLGKRMEHFFNYFITQLSSFEIVAQNEQIIFDKITLGELDFLLKDPASGEIFHVELIYKFYLYDPDTGTSEIDHLIGPNKRDSLNRKLQRLQKRQFPLLFDPATQKLLHSLQITPEDVLQKMCFKAFVFLPKLQDKIDFSEINEKTVAGYWIRLKDFTSKDYSSNLFCSPKKKHWPVSAEQNDLWYTYGQILQQITFFMERQLSVLVWTKNPAGEVQKFFIVWW